MVNFIKLTNMIINTKHINTILIKPHKYHIYIMNCKKDGFCLFSSGIFWSDDQEIEICSNKQSIDYKIITDWMKTI